MISIMIVECFLSFFPVWIGLPWRVWQRDVHSFLVISQSFRFQKNSGLFLFFVSNASFTNAIGVPFHLTDEMRNGEILEKGERLMDKGGSKVSFDCWCDWSSVLQIESDWGETWTKTQPSVFLSFPNLTLLPQRIFFQSSSGYAPLSRLKRFDEKGERGRILFNHRCGERWKNTERLEGEWEKGSLILFYPCLRGCVFCSLSSWGRLWCLPLIRNIPFPLSHYVERSLAS